MAKAYLNEGATSLINTNWDDATGFADNAQLIIDKPFGGNQPLTSAVDQSALTVGIDYLHIRQGAIGQLGTGGSPIKVDADTAAGDGVSNHGFVDLYLNAAGGSGVINDFDCGGKSRNWLVGGTFGQVTVQGGQLNVNESTVVTNFDAYGGGGVIEYNATAITVCRIMSGKWIIKRKCTNLIIGQNAEVTYDLDEQGDLTGATVTSYGGKLIGVNAPFPTALFLGGDIELSAARREFEIGSTSITLGGTTINEGSGLVTLSNIEYVGAAQRSVSGKAGAIGLAG